MTRRRGSKTKPVSHVVREGGAGIGYYSLLRGRQRPSWQDLRPLILEGSTPVPEAGCWLWLGAVDRHGYGTRRLGPRGQAKNWFAHRLSYLAFVGDLLPFLEIMHTCDTPSCVNPAHLRQVSHAANMNDMAAKGRHWSRRLG